MTHSSQKALFALSRKIKTAGKCFLVATAPSLAEMDLDLLGDWPTIGVNLAYRGYEGLDALIMSDQNRIREGKWEIKAWQRRRKVKPVLFWYNVQQKNGWLNVAKWLHSRDTKAIIDNRYLDEVPVFAVCHSIITCAVNCAYWLGAKEIYLCGVELDCAHHFYDKVATEQEKKRYHPHQQKVWRFINAQRILLARRGVSLVNCTPRGALQKILKYMPLEVAVKKRGRKICQ